MTQGTIITTGSHLTVTTYPDGSRTLVWDDEALLRDVREAIASLENPKAVAAPKKPRKPRVSKKKKTSE